MYTPPGRHRSRGFTLLEVLIVIAIIGTLAAIAIPNFLGYRERVRIVVAIKDLRMISAALDHYFLDHGHHPDDLAEVGFGGLLDPWGTPYQYLNITPTTPPGKLRKLYGLVPVNADYDLYSRGRDGKSQTPFTAKASRDDIVRANNGAYYGLVSDYD